MMAVLTTKQLAENRQGVQSEGDVATWVKADLNAALQAIEDEWGAIQAELSTAIDVATSPLVFSNAMKKKIGKYWLKQRFGRGG